jgi:quercetin dioxygenase-like cupin family protein
MPTQVSEVQIGKYIKNRFISEDGQREVSIIDWLTGSRTPRHDHSVNEITYVLLGRIFQIVDGRKTYHQKGECLIVPAGTIHEVGVDAGDPAARTLNICDGLLEMKTYPSSSIE